MIKYVFIHLNAWLLCIHLFSVFFPEEKVQRVTFLRQSSLGPLVVETALQTKNERPTYPQRRNNDTEVAGMQMRSSGGRRSLFGPNGRKEAKERTRP